MFTFDSLEPGEVEGEGQLRGRPGDQQDQDQEAEAEGRSAHEVSTEVGTFDTYTLQLEVGRVWPMSPPSGRCAVVSTASSLLRPAPPLASRYHPPSPDTSHTITCTASLYNSYCYLHVGV